MDKFFNKYISKIEEWILSYSVIVMAIILIGSVISRSVFNRSWTFSEEVGQILTIIVTFLGVGYCTKKARHISMSAIFDLLSIKYKKVFMLIISSLSSVSMFYIAYLGLKYTQKVQTLGRVTPALRIPTYIIIAIVPIGFFLGAIEYARTFFKNIKNKELYLSSEVIFGADSESLCETNRQKCEEVL
ncbi:TRAP transporter small permease [Lutispora sp.]|uniref:TRAP transporter small permease n=1 Tax=Lutispora sp. TaxID=2828727 RepID=UPI002B210C7D|nr:TRAP transporter small permease [Lutispora sp.]MEA4960808.1 TRAP transporter small permease [Lutispora sp.]